jgi:phosphate transport system ATP-binding protein
MPIIDIKNFSFTYPNGKKILKNINLEIQNTITALIGPSGCGKSTLLRSLNRIHDIYSGHKYEGEILFENKNILDLKSEDELIKLRRKIGMIFQKPTPFPMSIFDNVAYGLRISGINNVENRVEEALKDASLWDNVKDRLDSSALNLSGGEQQRLCIARAIALKPKVLLFDEPTSALDPISAKAIEELILRLKENITIIIVTHNMQQAKRISDYTAFMYLGEIIEYNKTKNIFSSAKQQKTKDYIMGKFG